MQKIPLLDMKAQLAPIEKQLKKAISAVIDSGGFILGEETRLFEEKVCEYCNIKYAIGVSNGTDAIKLSLKALGIKRGDKVICPSFTYYATAGAIVDAGAEPIFVDIDPDTYCIDPASVELYFKRSNSKQQRATKAIIPVHLYGQCADMRMIRSIAKRYNLKIIEDTAQAFGATYKDKKAGTIGDCGTVSFYPGKNLGACGDAGLVLTNSRSLASELRILRDQGADPSDKYRHICLGYNNRLDALQAAILSIKLDCLDKWNKRRKEHAGYYDKSFKDTDLKTPYISNGNTHTYHQYVLRAKSADKKDKIVDYLTKKGIDSRTYYSIPLHLQPCFKYLGYKKGDLPESEKAAKETFVIPVYSELTKDQMNRIVRAVKEALK